MNSVSTTPVPVFPSGPILLPFAALGVLMIVAMWKVFTKAGKPGWWAIIPLVNTFVLIKIAGKPGWWMPLILIPIVNIVIFVLVYSSLSGAFGRGAGFTVGIIFLPWIFVPILGFGSSSYRGSYGGQIQPSY